MRLAAEMVYDLKIKERRGEEISLNQTKTNLKIYKSGMNMVQKSYKNCTKIVGNFIQFSCILFT